MADTLGKQTRELLGERDLSMTEATAVIARGIGKPDLRYEQFPYDQVQQVWTQMGIPPKPAALYIEMYKAINAGVLAPPEPRSPENTTPSSFEEFVQDVFAAAYHGKAPTAWSQRPGGTVAPVSRREFREAAPENCRCSGLNVWLSSTAA